MTSPKPIHFLRSDNYYACIRAVGTGIMGLATKNKSLVTCKNCLKYIKAHKTRYWKW